MRNIKLGNGLYIRWSAVNQAWFVLWHQEVLRIIPTLVEVEAYLLELGARKGGG